MKTIKALFAFVGLLSLSGLLIFAVQDAPSDENLEKKIINDYNVYALNVPDHLDFAGEAMPLEDPDILERMDRELLVNTYWQSNGLLMFKRANKYFPIIEPILSKYGIPDDFKYLAVIESGLTNAVSPANAKGFWQIMRTTGRENGLEINHNVDERYHLENPRKLPVSTYWPPKKSLAPGPLRPLLIMQACPEFPAVWINSPVRAITISSWEKKPEDIFLGLSL